jgi:nicotinic acid mononucleotide adenylyltransferase
MIKPGSVKTWYLWREIFKKCRMISASIMRKCKYSQELHSRCKSKDMNLMRLEVSPEICLLKTFIYPASFSIAERIRL